MSTLHTPVMLSEVLSMLNPQPGGCYIDGTVGGGGHAEAVLDASTPGGRLLGLDRDPSALKRAAQRLERFGTRVTLVGSDFRAMRSIAASHGFAHCQAVLLDLGLSSDQLAATERGFSFQTVGPLDMRFGSDSGQTAADILNTATESDLADIFYHYAEERRSRRLARLIVERRRSQPFNRTDELVAVTSAALGGRRGRLHPATRVFQALRIAVNDELGALREGLAAAANLLAEGGRLVVISFQSLEDRIVKQFFRGHARLGEAPELLVLTRKPLRPRPDEVAANPRSRGAKLRAAEKVASPAV